jgi:hypothetical protein
MQGFECEALFFQGEAFQALCHPLAIGGQGCDLIPALLDGSFLLVKACQLTLNPSASGVDLCFFRFEIDKVNGFADVCRFPPLYVFLALGKLALVCLRLRGLRILFVIRFACAASKVSGSMSSGISTGTQDSRGMRCHRVLRSGSTLPAMRLCLP